jgi:ubiquinone/menaquinone biosynthesis C-methylase UbiE
MSAFVTAQQREQAAQSFFDRWARTYDAGRITSWFHYTQRLAMEQLEIGAHSRVLDVGCGTGYATRYAGLLVTSGQACGVDISHAMIERARAQTSPDLAARVEFRQGSSASLPYSDKSFTHLLCTNSFHHYPDPMQALSEMKRVLVPGGQIAVLENAPDLSWYTWAWDRLLRIVEKGHVRYYPSRELGAMIVRTGFRCVELRLLRNEFLKHGKLFASIQLWTAQVSASDGATAHRSHCQ